MAERTVRFYEIVTEQKERIVKQLPFDDLRAAITELPDDEAYVGLGRMEILGSTHELRPGVGARREVPLIVLDRINRTPGLRIERQRNYRPLLLEEDETLAEPSFYSIFEGNILGVMRNNGSAPGPASFRDYVNKLRLLTEDIEIAPLVDSNALRALADVGTLTKLQIEVGPDVVADVFGDRSLIADPLRIFRKRLGSVGFELTLKISPKGQQDTAELVHQEVSSLVEGNGLAFTEKAKINYRRLEDGRAAMHDFISEAVATTAEVLLN